ncbi:PRC-barrel domain-containing protein [Rhodopseudomonas sp. HC1]|uniref:PRC-barrel domain-containing protein n=1 Tax=Rhodopseudomonas infernalis TaxID=2897386 RepID=UPI001EE8CE3E|nr:PRC-barrel domain-containing protein [Rhodopseudomonas infernalis]MCG6203715.1 PRC-barrel domain-containing protein [Rhodopseudomonas infernalis]
MKKTNTVLAGLLGSTLIATAAFAQSPAATDSSMSKTTAAPAASSMSANSEWRASKMIGLNVYNQANEKLGDISEVLLDKAGKVHAVVIGVGGFLGVGQHDVAVKFDQLKFVDTPVKSTTASTTAPAGSATTTTAPATTTGAATTTTTTTTSNTNSTAERMYPDHAVFDATKDQLKAMPEFKYGRS